jgi:hypothetical protein
MDETLLWIIKGLLIIGFVGMFAVLGVIKGED